MSERPLAVIVLAAGKGTRMKSALPKAMHELAGKPMLRWVLDAAQVLSPEKIVVVAGPEMPELEKAAKPHRVVIQREQNGTGAAAQCGLSALKGFDGDVLIVLGDAPLVSHETLAALVEACRADLLTGLSVLGVRLDNPSGYGRLVTDKQGAVTHIVEEKDADAKDKLIELVNAGAFCAGAQNLRHWLGKLDNKNAQGEYYLTDLPKIAAEGGAVCALSLCMDADEVRGCNTRADLAALEGLLQARLRREHMEAGVTMADPDSVYFSHDTQIGPDCAIEPSVFFGPGVRVGAGARIRAFSHLEDAVIGEKTSIGPFARLVGQVKIGEEVKLGTFVEVKRSTIGNRSKMAHLAYVGDCQMGEDVNFSCGAITVNYDGFQKHQTVIGKGVMVGSNVNLVAPLSIDDGAFIAAGSTITEDVPADALSIARDVAQIREGWAAKYRKLKQAAAKRRRKAG